MCSPLCSYEPYAKGVVSDTGHSSPTLMPFIFVHIGEEQRHRRAGGHKNREDGARCGTGHSWGAENPPPIRQNVTPRDPSPTIYYSVRPDWASLRPLSTTSLPPSARGALAASPTACCPVVS